MNLTDYVLMIIFGAAVGSLIGAVLAAIVGSRSWR